MMKTFLSASLGVSILVFSTTSAAAKFVAPSICERFATSPEKFPRLKPQAIVDDIKKRFSVSLDGKTQQKIEIHPSDGSAGGDGLCMVTKDECDEFIFTNIETNGYGMGLSYFLIQDSKKTYMVGETSPEAPASYDFLGEVSPQGIKVLCEFRKKLIGYKEPTDKEGQALCRDVTNDQFKKIRAVKGKAQQLEADLLHDGSPLQFTSAEGASGAGAGCDRQYLVLAKKNAKKNAEAIALNKALTEKTDSDEYCNSPQEWSLVKVQGKDYLMGGPNGKLPLVFKGKRKAPRQELWAYQAGHFKLLCGQDPRLEIEVVPPESN